MASWEVGCRAFWVPPQHRPQLLRCVLCIGVYSWLLKSSSSATQAALLATLFLLWSWWETLSACQLRDTAVRGELRVQLRVADFAAGSNCTQSEASRRFKDVRRQTQCLFAPRALVWGNDWSTEWGLDGNIARCLPRLYRFCLEVKAGQALDGFVIEVRGAQYGADVQRFAGTVRRVLVAVSAADPSGVNCMGSGNVGRRGWYFQFAGEPLFITTFAPCYPSSNPRYQFGVHADSCFVLLQPEESFYRHDLPPDKPRSATNWDEPSDIRDRIRVNFRRRGREYRIPETTAYPPAEFIVLPLHPLSDPPVEFWRLPGEQ